MVDPESEPHTVVAMSLLRVARSHLLAGEWATLFISGTSRLKLIRLCRHSASGVVWVYLFITIIEFLFRGADWHVLVTFGRSCFTQLVEMSIESIKIMVIGTTHDTMPKEWQGLTYEQYCYKLYDLGYYMIY